MSVIFDTQSTDFAHYLNIKMKNSAGLDILTTNLTNQHEYSKKMKNGENSAGPYSLNVNDRVMDR